MRLCLLLLISLVLCYFTSFSYWVYQPSYAASFLSFKYKPKVETILQAQNLPSVKQEKLTAFLLKKQSSLVTHVKNILSSKNWKLIISVSAIESQFCKRQLGYNCWGVKGNNGYRHYKDYEEAINDVSSLIDKWQAKGRWLTLEDMNGSYVVPASANWLRITKTVYNEL